MIKDNGRSSISIGETDKFNGTFTPYYCSLLKKRRQEIGLSFADTGKLLGVGWNTVRNWELGKVKKCQGRHIMQLRKFMRNELDLKGLSRFRQFIADPNVRQLFEYMKPLLKNTSGCMEYANVLEQLGRDFISNVIEIIKFILKSLNIYCKSVINKRQGITPANDQIVPEY